MDEIKFELEKLDSYLYGAFIACYEENASNAFGIARNHLAAILRDISDQESNEL